MSGHGPDAAETVDAQETAIEESVGTGIAHAREGARDRTAGAGSEAGKHMGVTVTEGTVRKLRAIGREAGIALTLGEPETNALIPTDRRIVVGQRGEITVTGPGLGHKDVSETTVPTPSRKSVALALEAALHPVVCSRIVRRRYINT